MNTKHVIARFLLPLWIVGTAMGAQAHERGMRTTNFRSRSTFQSLISGLDSSHKDILELAVDPSGEWMVLSESQVDFSPGFPADPKGVVNALRNLYGLNPDAVAFSPAGGWAIVARGSVFSGGSVPFLDTLRDKVAEFYNAGSSTTELALGAGGWVLIAGDSAWTKGSVPADLPRAVLDRHASGRKISSVQIGFDGRWVLCADQWCVGEGLSSTQRSRLDTWAAEARKMDGVWLGLNGDYLYYKHDEALPTATNFITKMEYKIKPTTGGSTTNLFERMQTLGVPGVSIAVIENNKVAYARAYGVRTAGTQSFVSTDTPFDAASITKFIGAIGVMRLVREGRVTLDQGLDEYIDANYVGSNPLAWWRWAGQASPGTYGLPNSGLTPGMSLRRLLSHSAAVSPTGKAGALGSGGGSPSIIATDWSTPSTLQGVTLPNLNGPEVHLLLGYEGNKRNYAKRKMVWFDPALTLRGTEYEYSGGGYLLADAWSVALTGQSYDTHMQQRVLNPIGMPNSTFQTVLPASFASRVAERHDANGNVVNPEVVYSWASAGGFYTTAQDYAKALALVMNGGLFDNGGEFLKRSQASELISNQLPTGVTTNACDDDGQDNDNDGVTDEVGETGPNCGNRYYGLGTNMASAIRSTDPNVWSNTFWHSGSHNPGTTTYMMGRPGTDHGVVIMINGTSSTSAAGVPNNVMMLRNEIREAFKCEAGVGASC